MDIIGNDRELVRLLIEYLKLDCSFGKLKVYGILLVFVLKTNQKENVLKMHQFFACAFSYL